MIIPIELRFKADKGSKSAFRTEKTIKSHDINSVEFHISIDGFELTANHTAKILSVFHTSKSQANVDCEIVDGKIIYKPDTNLISRHEHVTNYVYVYHNNQSLDVREFIYIVDLSKIDETSLEVKEMYDQSYADLLADFEQALNDYKDNLPQADSVRADIDEILNQFSVDSQAKLSLINEAEESRIEAEGQRESAEANRVSAESSRVSAESERVLAENERSEKYESYAQQFNDVITDLSEEKDYHSLPEIAAARGGHDTLGQRLDDTTAQLAHIVTDVKLVEGEDATKKIQTALDKKGWVRIAKPGLYFISSTLVIGSNTFLELYPGVELRLKAGARTYMLKNSDQINGNENIFVKGGTWNTDYLNNPARGAIPAWPGHGIFMHKVKNLKFEDLINKNNPKYCYAIVDVENFIAENIGLDNPNSDGLHFMPPLKNAYINNIWGHTDDDMISFTLGDYASYQVSNVGDFESVYIKHVTCDNVKSIVKMTGSGQDSAYKFRDFYISNLTGTITRQAIFIMDDPDDPSGAQNLVNTKVEGITIKGVKTQGGTNPTLYFDAGVGGDVLIEDVKANPEGRLLSVSGKMGNMVMRDVEIHDVAPNTDIIYFEPDAIVESFTAENVHVVGQNSTQLFKILGQINRLNLNNVSFNAKGTNSVFLTIETGAIVNHVFMNNMYTGDMGYLFHISESTTFKITNSHFYSPITNGIFITGASNVRIIGNNNTFTSPITPYFRETGTCSINDSSWKASFSKIKPEIGDVFYNTTDQSGAANPFTVGPVIWDGTKLKNTFAF